MLDYASSKSVKLVAYMYPILAFLAEQDPMPPWIINGSYSYLASPASPAAVPPGLSSNRNGGPLRTSLASPEFIDWVVKTMLAFANVTGAGGFGFDYTYFEDDHASIYAQWAGWRDILAGLRSGNPELVVDNRQQNHAWGPWMWAAGSYAEPLMSDEQPGSCNIVTLSRFACCSSR